MRGVCRERESRAVHGVHILHARVHATIASPSAPPRARGEHRRWPAQRAGGGVFSPTTPGSRATRLPRVQRNSSILSAFGDAVCAAHKNSVFPSAALRSFASALASIRRLAMAPPSTCGQWHIIGQAN